MSDPALAVIKAYIEKVELERAPVSDTASLSSLIKASAEQQFTLGLAYPANVAPGRGADGFNDFVSERELEKTAWAWMTKSRSIGLCHEEGTEGHGTVVESYIYRGPDWKIQDREGNPQVIKAGSWMLGTLWDDISWSLIKDKLLNGFSPQGSAKRVPATPERLSALGMK